MTGGVEPTQLTAAAGSDVYWYCGYWQQRPSRQKGRWYADIWPDAGCERSNGVNMHWKTSLYDDGDTGYRSSYWNSWFGVVKQKFSSSAAPDVVVLPSLSARPSRAAPAVGDALSSPRQSVQIDQVTTHGKHDASLPLYDTPTSVSATHLAQLSPAESEELSGHLFRRMIPPKSTRRFIPAHRYPHHQQQNSLSER